LIEYTASFAAIASGEIWATVRRGLSCYLWKKITQLAKFFAGKIEKTEVRREERNGKKIHSQRISNFISIIPSFDL